MSMNASQVVIDVAILMQSVLTLPVVITVTIVNLATVLTAVNVQVRLSV
jgi:hypothetical protein